MKMFTVTVDGPCFSFIEMQYCSSIIRIGKDRVSQIATWTVKRMKRYITCPVGMSANFKTVKNEELVLE
jgi:hypothetical protein